MSSSFLILIGIFSSISTSFPCSFRRIVFASTSFKMRLKSSLSTLRKWQLFSRVVKVADLIKAIFFLTYKLNTNRYYLGLYLGVWLTSDNFPKSSPSERVATVPLPKIDTSTDPFRIMYQDVASSPWLNTSNKWF